MGILCGLKSAGGTGVISSPASSAGEAGSCPDISDTWSEVCSWDLCNKFQFIIKRAFALIARWDSISTFDMFMLPFFWVVSFEAT